MFTRRGFMAAGASTLTVLGPTWQLAAQGAATTRRAVSGMAANDPDLVAYRRAVAAMKALPMSDPRNWTRFSLIHRDFCPHGNWYFLPWHRAYLTSLERICRQLSGKADFALPYWDWTADRRVPRAFTVGDPQSNPLNNPRPGANTALADDMVGRAVITRILNSPDFEAFGSTRPRGQDSTGSQWQRRMGSKTELEFNPHDGVHATVGGDMGTVARSSRDPIFYLHHANIDRLWSAWNGRGNANSPEANWRNFSFEQNFINPNGSPWDVAVGDLQSPQSLGYRYEGEDGPFAADINLSWAQGDPLTNHLLAYRRLNQDTLLRPTRELRRIELPMGEALYVAAAENDAMASRERPVAIPVPLGRPLAEVINPDALAALRIPEPKKKRERHLTRQCVWATMRDVEPPSDPNTRVHIFVNCNELSPGTPTTHPSYVTSLSFFGAEHMVQGSGGGHAAHARMGPGGAVGARGACVSVDLASALGRISRTRAFREDKIVVQMVPTCVHGDTEGTIIRPRRVEIAII